MSDWELKGIRSFSNDSTITWNPHLPLCLISTHKGVAISRPIDGQRIMALSWKKDEKPIGYQWETLHGRLFAVFFQNGTIKIFDGSAVGKPQGTLNLRGEDEPQLDFVLWDPVSWHKNNELLHVFDIDTSELMPQLVKLIKESRQLAMVSTENSNASWNKRESSDSYIILGHNRLNSEFILSIDGLINVNFQCGIPNIHKILSEREEGKYICLGKDMTVQHIKFDFLDCLKTREIIKCCSNIQLLSDYLLENIALCRTELIKPYRNFMVRVSDAYDDDLQSSLLDVLFTGTVPSNLEDWLCNTIGDKNMRKWRHLSTKLYSDLNKIMILTIIPACERLILGGERLHGIIKGLKFLKFGYENHEDKLDALDVVKYIDLCTKMLETTLSCVKDLNMDTNLHEVFIEWLQDVVLEAVDEDYKRKIPYDYNPLKIEQFISRSWYDSKLIDGCDVQLFELAGRISTQTEQLTNSYARRWIKQQITVEPVFLLETGSTNVQILDTNFTEHGQLLVLYYDGISNRLAIATCNSSDIHETHSTKLYPFENISNGHVKDAKFFSEGNSIIVLRESSNISVIKFHLSLSGRIDVLKTFESSIAEGYAFDSLQVSKANLLSLCSSNDEKMALYEYHVNYH